MSPGSKGQREISATTEMDEQKRGGAALDVQPGALLGGRYRIVRLIGSGGMGTVYLAHDGILGKEVALKFLDARWTEDCARREQLRNEVLLAHEVSHRNVCRTYDLEEIEGRWPIKMEYVDGETLAARVARVGALEVKEAVAIANQIIDGLGAAHERHVVHRDLKPQNVVIEARTGRVVLMDFGLARMTELVGTARDGFAGTPAYVAPEQARGQ